MLVDSTLWHSNKSFITLTVAPRGS